MTGTMSDDSDAALLADWREGDQEAFALLVARYHGLVRTACVRQAVSGDAAAWRWMSTAPASPMASMLGKLGPVPI